MQKKLILDPVSNHKQKLAQKGPHETIVYLTAKTIKFSQESRDVCLYALGLASGFLDTTPKLWPTKDKIHKLYFVKIKHFSAINITNK